MARSTLESSAKQKARNKVRKTTQSISALSQASKLLQQSFTGGQFLFGLDDKVLPAAFVQSVRGGTVKGKIMEEQVGPAHYAYKHVGNVEIEPITVELGMSVSKPIIDWIRDSWKLQYSRRNGFIVHANRKYKARYTQEFSEALITETKFPELDATTKEPAYLTVSLHPEDLKIREDKVPYPLLGRTPRTQKEWTSNNFRLVLNREYGHIRKIESFSVKQKVTQLYYGSSRFPEVEPTGIEFGNVVVHMPLSHANDFVRWHEQVILKGAKAPKEEQNGFIEYLSPNTKKVLLRVHLNGVGLHGLSIADSKAGEAETKLCKIELYVESMDIEYGTGTKLPF